MGSVLSARNESIVGSLNRSAIGCSWRSLIAVLVNQVCTADFRIVPPEMNPLISGDPSALLEKLIIDAAFIELFRKCENAIDCNWGATPSSLACRLNVKYQVL